ncbi:MAG TPA: hypothetical protein VIM42_08800 [Clostridium sp.]
MEFLRWVGGIVVFIWAFNLIFKFGGNMAPLLTVISPVVFIIAMTFGRKKRAS